VSALLMRILGRTESTVTMTFWFVTLVSVLSLTFSLPNWVPIIWTDWPWLLTVGVCGALGQYLITEAFRSAQPSVVAPFEYTAMLWGLGFDFVLWSALPGTMTMLGASVVIGSGLYLLRQEAKTNS
jgi:drug/metabolite transporter (DMT)-like permease